MPETVQKPHLCLYFRIIELKSPIPPQPTPPDQKMADISDILADVSRDPFAEYDETYASADKGRLHPGQADLQALTRAWINERGAAELLPYEPPPPSAF